MSKLRDIPALPQEPTEDDYVALIRAAVRERISGGVHALPRQPDEYYEILHSEFEGFELAIDVTTDAEAAAEPFERFRGSVPRTDISFVASLVSMQRECGRTIATYLVEQT